MTGTHDEDIDGFFSNARVSGREGAIALPSDSYRQSLFDLDDPTLAEWRGLDYEEFSRARRKNPFLQELLTYWDSLYDEPFRGITTDGVIRDGLYALPPHPMPDADARAAAEAAHAALQALSSDERKRFAYPIDASEWRGWSNPEFVFHRVGLRLECLDQEKIDAIFSMIEATLSPEGYQRVREAMRLNGFLGELTKLQAIMNDRSYWVSLYGAPSDDGPWGWQLFGHHVAVNFVTVGGRDVAAPVFIGGEPALSDEDAPALFAARERFALELASSLTPAQRADAIVYQTVLDPAMPEGRLHPADERHVAGAFRDNRVIPYEGVVATALDERQRALLRDIVEDAHSLLRDRQRELTMADYDAHVDDTWFSWYGATDGSQPFYFRVQSPVIVTELDDHAGVWLSNRLPARFHIHTTLRLPNGNDYAGAYLTEWREREREQREAREQSRVREPSEEREQGAKER